MRRKLTEEQRGEIRLWVEEVLAFEAKFPNHCSTCHGWSEYMGKECPDCVAIGECPICGEKIEELEWPPYGKECTDPDCGWSSTGNVDGISDPPECTSWFDFLESRRLGYV